MRFVIALMVLAMVGMLGWQTKVTIEQRLEDERTMQLEDDAARERINLIVKHTGKIRAERLRREQARQVAAAGQMPSATAGEQE